MKETAIVVPCYNESKRLNIQEFRLFLKENPQVFFILVDDGSSDNTLELLERIKGFAPDDVHCFKLPKNMGKAEAVRQGILKAIEIGFNNVGYWDADLSTPLDLINKMADKLKDRNITIVLGARVKLLGYDIRRKTLRHYSGRLYATFASMVLQLPVYDTQCGAKIFRNNSELQKVFSQPFKVNWSFDVEILGRFKIIKEREGKTSLAQSALEYPLEKWVHMGGSKVKFTDFFKGLLELFKIFLLLHVPIIKKRYANHFR